MRILHLLHQYLPEYVGGTELYTQTVAAALQTNHSNAIFYRLSRNGAGLHQRQDPDGLTVWAAWHGRVSPTSRFRATFRDPAIHHAFTQVLDDFQPDVVHVQHLMGLPASLLNALRQRRIPYLVTLHDYWWLCANAQLLTNYDETVCAGPHYWLNCGRCALARAGKGDSRLLGAGLAPLLAARERLLRPHLHHAHTLIAPTRFVQTIYQQMGLSPEQITVLPHGIELPVGSGQLIVSSEQSPVSPSLRLCYIGGIAPQKGVHVLIEAVNGLPEGVALTIGGDMETFPEYAAALRTQATHPGITFLGRLSREQVWPQLRQSDALVVPTLWYETASLIVQEAFAVGTPVIASRIGVMPERIQDGVDGRLFPAGDAAALRAILLEMLHSPHHLHTLRQGIQPVFTVSEHLTGLERVYQLAVSSRQPTAH
ncbi:MAG: glycosyltransferase family 4 protein [Anaerolineae bacterium]|nr:glycosyltransferase family 4 protein [Anaerolineae bacterium]